MRQITLTPSTDITQEFHFTCPLGCKIFPDIDDLEEIKNKGVHYGQVLNDNNVFLCHDLVNGAYLGNVSTDREKIVPFINEGHLKFFVDLYKSSLPNDVEYQLTNDFKAIDDLYKWEIVISE